MALLSQQFMEAVVSLDEKTKDGFQTIATGFLVGFRSGMKDQEGKDLFRIFIVTCKHVLKDKKEIWLKFNKGDSSEHLKYEFNDAGDPGWVGHKDPDIDVAVIPIDINWLKLVGVECPWIPENIMAFSKDMKGLGISEGEDVFVLGFPLGKAGEIKKYVVVRKGMISRLDEEIIRTENCFLIDCFVFPGNSGGPVILKPNLFSIKESKSVQTAYLLGVISGYIHFDEVAYSNPNSSNPEPRITFRSNTGLTKVVPMDYVKEIVMPFILKEIVIRKKRAVKKKKKVIKKKKKVIKKKKKVIKKK